MSNIIQYLSFSVWLISLSIMPIRSIHVAAKGKTSFFLWLSSIPFYIYTTSSLSIHLLMDTYVASTPWQLWTTLLWTMGCMYLFKLVFLVCLGYIREIAGSYGHSIFSFLYFLFLKGFHGLPLIYKFPSSVWRPVHTTKNNNNDYHFLPILLCTNITKCFRFINLLNSHGKLLRYLQLTDGRKKKMPEVRYCHRHSAL